MRRGLQVAVGTLALATIGFVAWWNGHRGASVDPTRSGDSDSAANESVPAPPPPLASPGLERRARVGPNVPAESRAGPASATEDRRVHGQVLDADGRPVVGALVHELAEPEPAATTTDAEGRFALTLTAPPPRGLLVRAPGLADAIVTAGASGIGLAIALEKGWTISGTVQDDATGEAIGAISVSARPSTSPQLVDPPSTNADAGGAFRLVVAEPGAYVLDVGTGYVGGVPTARDEWVPTRIEGVAAGTSGLRVTLARGRSIEGEIVDDHGERVTRRVWVDAVRRTATGDADYTTRKVVLADAGGLRVPGLPPGRYDLHVKPVADATDAGATRLSETVVKDIDAGTQGLVVRLFRGFLLVGRLEDGAGAPVMGSGALYAYRAGEMARSHPVIGLVPGDGTFRVGPLDESFRYDLLATGFAERRPTTKTGVSTRDADVVVVLEAGRRITGRVESEDGKPVPAAVPIGFVGEQPDPRSTGARTFAYTRADGTFVSDGLADVSFTVEAGGGRSGYLGTVVRGVKPGRTDLVLRVSVGVDLEGTLVDEKGDPIATTQLGADDGARVAAMRPYAQVGADGKFILRGLRAGPVRLTALLGGASVVLGSVGAPATGLKVVVPAR